MAGFIICVIVGCFFVGIGISAFFAKKTVGFWSNAKVYKVNDVRKYNHAVGKLWCTFGVVFVVLSTPMLDGQNSPLIIISILGIVAEVIALMIIYTQVIERKYRKQ